jgi:3-oxoacyl-[acyl-carrier protein] reductase
MLERIPAGRLGRSSEVASLVRFLASEKASYIPGETIQINGGMYMG